MAVPVSTDDASKKLKFERFCCLASSFLPAKAMQNNFRKFEELVFFDLWIPDSGFWFPGSGFRFRILVSGFLVLGLPIKYVERWYDNNT